jgi:hypothetical protein
MKNKILIIRQLEKLVFDSIGFAANFCFGTRALCSHNGRLFRSTNLRGLLVKNQFFKLFGYILSFWALSLYSAAVPEKVLICGIGKNIEHNIPNVIASATKLGEQFVDYRVIIYENNSKDKSKKQLRKWAKRDPRLILQCEDLSKKELAAQFKMKVYNRTEAIARARNIVLDIAMQHQFRDYKYVVWVDLDLPNPWDVDNIIDTILHPEQEWDAVLSNGWYDLFALRDPEFPIGFELIGQEWQNHIQEMTSRFSLDPNGPWRKVYSAFGGLGIYKRNAMKKCRYSGVVTSDLEKVVKQWLERAYAEKDVCFMGVYQWLLSSTYVIDLYNERLSGRHRLPDRLGVRLYNENGNGDIVWFSCMRGKTLPWTCEHVTFHASMILKGHDRIFINPRIVSSTTPLK